MLPDSSWRARPNGDVCECVAATVLEKMGKKAENSAHNGPQPGNKPVKLEIHPILSHKEA